MKHHQSGRAKLNMKQGHRKSVLRNQVASFIKYDTLQTTTAHVKVVRSIVEKLVTIAREGVTFNVIRRIRQELPYEMDVVNKLVKQIAPKYVSRPGGYTKILSLGKRMSDTANISRLEWV